MSRSAIIEVLQRDILQLQGYKFSGSTSVYDLGPMCEAFPSGAFPISSVHEFLISKPEDYSATGGFISALLSPLIHSNGAAAWISSSRKIYPPALKSFGVEPDRIIFIDLKQEKDVLWTFEEALKCNALTAVVAELSELGFTESRRLQLAVERSGVTGFVLRRESGKVNTTACLSRWRISSVASDPIDELPGIGFPRWRVEVLRMRNGKTGVWIASCIKGKLEITAEVNLTANKFSVGAKAG